MIVANLLPYRLYSIYYVIFISLSFKCLCSFLKHYSTINETIIKMKQRRKYLMSLFLIIFFQESLLLLKIYVPNLVSGYLFMYVVIILEIVFP